MNNNQEQPPPADVSEVRLAALQMAVLHHGLANMSNNAVPAGWPSVLKTSNYFVQWLTGHAPEDKPHEVHTSNRQ